MKSRRLFQEFIGKFKGQDSSDYSEEKFITMVNEGFEQGKLLGTEAEMIQNIIAFGNKVAKDVMSTRKNIQAIEKHTSLKETLDYMLNERNSRFPVYEENIDVITGILHLRDVVKAYMNEDLRDRPISEISGMTREAVFIPEHKKILELFSTMKNEKTQMVVVVDEYGQTAGLIAMEDIIEEIVGNILDEYDEEEAYIEEIEKQSQFIIEGKTPLEELEELLKIKFAEEEFETINGFLISRMDKIPDENEKFSIEIGSYTFEIITVENHMITSVLVTKS
ncbi:MAG: CBS domain-containing protein [Lachnospiraceae bacterium]|nr:CBS domain-containing protein [Lachnospiraceae bacterium]